MLDGLKRLFGASAAAKADRVADEWAGVAPWAESRHYAFRAVHDQGFVVDGRCDDTPWRMEWGPSQRPYMCGSELRLRAEPGVPAELQAVVMNRALQDTMEQAVFEQFVEGVQTRIDNQTPPEMRWLVMHPQLPAADMSGLRERYVAVAGQLGWLRAWLQGPLAAALAAQARFDEVPMVLMLGRGRLMLRTALPDVQVDIVQRWLRLFETAVREARRAQDQAGTPGDDRPAAASGWHTSLTPDAGPG